MAICQRLALSIAGIITCQKPCWCFSFSAPKGQNAEASLRLDLSKEDVADMDLFNRILWRAIKGDGVPYPDAKQMSSLEYIRGR